MTKDNKCKIWSKNQNKLFKLKIKFTKNAQSRNYRNSFWINEENLTKYE